MYFIAIQKDRNCVKNCEMKFTGILYTVSVGSIYRSMNYHNVRYKVCNMTGDENIHGYDRKMSSSQETIRMNAYTIRQMNHYCVVMKGKGALYSLLFAMRSLTDFWESTCPEKLYFSFSKFHKFVDKNYKIGIVIANADCPLMSQFKALTYLGCPRSVVNS